MGTRLWIQALTLGTVVLVGGGWLTRVLWRGRAPEALPEVGAPAPRRPSAGLVAARVRPLTQFGLRVGTVTGPVQRRAGPGGAWRDVAPGEVLTAGEALRTGSGGAAVLELEDRTTVWIWPESEVGSEQLGEALARLQLAGGRVDLNVPSRRGRAVEVRAPEGATARTEGARFSVIVDGSHVATVATREGEVEVLSGDGRVRVPPGMQTRARPGEAPEVVAPIPPELLLSVDWPRSQLRARSAVVQGQAPAGVLVSVRGVRVATDPEGRFRAQVPLEEGDNAVEVQAEDVLGRRVVRRNAVRVDTRPPELDTRGGWR